MSIGDIVIAAYACDCLSTSTCLLSKSICRIPQFLHHMLNVSALLLNTALLKCVVEEVVSFSIVAFKTLTFHKVV